MSEREFVLLFFRHQMTRTKQHSSRSLIDLLTALPVEIALHFVRDEQMGLIKLCRNKELAIGYFIEYCRRPPAGQSASSL